MANVINGSDLMLFINGKSLAFATSHKLSISADTTETSSKDSSGSWTTKKVKKLSWTASTENLYSEDGAGDNFDDLFDLMIAKAEISAVFTIKSDTTEDVPTTGWATTAGKGYTGKVIITSLEANAPNDENATYTASFEGVGALAPVVKA